MISWRVDVTLKWSNDHKGGLKWNVDMSDFVLFWWWKNHGSNKISEPEAMRMCTCEPVHMCAHIHSGCHCLLFTVSATILVKVCNTFHLDCYSILFLFLPVCDSPNDQDATIIQGCFSFNIFSLLLSRSRPSHFNFWNHSLFFLKMWLKTFKLIQMSEEKIMYIKILTNYRILHTYYFYY